MPPPLPPETKPEDGKACTRIGESTAHKVCVETDAVIGELRAQPGVIAPVAVPHDSAGLIDKRMPLLQHAKEHFQITAAVGHCADIQGRIKPADLRKQAAAVGHIGSGAEPPCANVKRVPLSILAIQAIPLAFEATPKATILLKEQLWLGFGVLRAPQCGPPPYLRR